MLHGHNACSLNTVIETEPGILQIMEVFFINTPACFDHNIYGDGALLCNTATLFSVTEKKNSDGLNRQVLVSEGLVVYAKWLIVL
jgi:hypothetical protein